MKKVLVIIGTRPEAIKLAPVIHALQRAKDRFEIKICDTGQHQSLKQPILDFFQIQTDVQLAALGANTSLGALTAYLLTQIETVIVEFQPDFVVVQGDTTSALAGAWAAFYQQKRVIHVEAGLRTHDLEAPFPEEMNRQVIARLASLHFAPTVLAVQHLINEGIPESNIHLVGNTVVDALFFALAKIRASEPDAVTKLRTRLTDFSKKYDKMLLLTLHRRENLQHHLPTIGAAIKTVLQRTDCFVVFPVHPNPGVKTWASQLAGELTNLLLLEPQPYEAFVWLMQQSDLILTDSGGIQEEAPSLGKPVLVLRARTERPEAQKEGFVQQIGVEQQAIEMAAEQVLRAESQPRFGKNPYGDGQSAARIVKILKKISEA